MTPESPSAVIFDSTEDATHAVTTQRKTAQRRARQAVGRAEAPAADASIDRHTHRERQLSLRTRLQRV